MPTHNKVGVMTFTTPTDREIVATRVLDALRDLVWRAHTNPNDVKHWMLGPPGWTMPVCEIDLRPGGTWRHIWRREDGTEMALSGTYREVRAPEKLVSTEAWGGDWPETTNTSLFTEEQGRTTLTCTVLYPSKESRDAATQTGMKDGWSRSYELLDEYLRTIQ